jgi:hypothetical protein
MTDTGHATFVPNAHSGMRLTWAHAMCHAAVGLRKRAVDDQPAVVPAAARRHAAVWRQVREGRAVHSHLLVRQWQGADAQGPQQGKPPHLLTSTAAPIHLTSASSIQHVPAACGIVVWCYALGSRPLQLQANTVCLGHDAWLAALDRKRATTRGAWKNCEPPGGLPAPTGWPLACRLSWCSVHAQDGRLLGSMPLPSAGHAVEAASWKDTSTVNICCAFHILSWQVPQSGIIMR